MTPLILYGGVGAASPSCIRTRLTRASSRIFMTQIAGYRNRLLADGCRYFHHTHREKHAIIEGGGIQLPFAFRSPGLRWSQTLIFSVKFYSSCGSRVWTAFVPWVVCPTRFHQGKPPVDMRLHRQIQHCQSPSHSIA
jgi:hypothetical protein